MSNIFQLKRGTASAWTTANPILAEGEMAIEKVTHQFKIGDGVTAWNSLAYGGLVGPAGANGTSGVDGFLIAGGQNFTADKVIGSNDNYSLTFKVNSTNQFFIKKDGSVTIGRENTDFNFVPKTFGAFVYQTTTDNRSFFSFDSSFAYSGATSDSKDATKFAMALRPDGGLYSGEYNVLKTDGYVSLDGQVTTFNGLKAVVASANTLARITNASSGQFHVVTTQGIIRNAIGVEVADSQAMGTDTADHIATGVYIGGVIAGGSSTNNTAYGLYIANTISATDTNPTSFAIKSLSTSPSTFAGSLTSSNLSGTNTGDETKFLTTNNTASPNATIPVVALTVNNASTDVDFAFVPKGLGAFMLQVPTGTTAGGNKRGNNACDLQTSSRSLATQVASGLCSFAVGNRNIVSGSYASAVGNANTSSGTASIAYGNGNTASGSNSVAIGFQNGATNSVAIAIGQSNVANGSASVAIGTTNGSTGIASTALGDNITASGDSSLGTGSRSNTFSVIGRHSHASFANGTVGDSQWSRFSLRAITTTATTSRLTANNGAVTINNQVTLQNNNLFYFTGSIIGLQNGSSNLAVWKVEGVVYRGANAGTTALVGTPTITAVTNVPGWSAPTIVADTTNGGLNITVTGTANNIKWHSNIETNEVIN